MKRRLMVLFLLLSAATVFAAGQKEEPPQKVLYRILSTAKEGNAKAVDEEFAPISVDILPAVLYEEEASRRGGENGQVPALSLPTGTIPISSFDDFREIMKYFDFQIRGNAFRTDENGNRIFIGYVDITNRRFEPYYEAVCLPDGEEKAVFSEIDGETLFENVREYIKRDDKLTEMYPSFPLTLVYRDNRWVPDMETKESINAWNMAMSPYCPPDKAQVKRLTAKLCALSDKKTASSSEHAEEKESGAVGAAESADFEGCGCSDCTGQEEVNESTGERGEEAVYEEEARAGMLLKNNDYRSIDIGIACAYLTAEATEMGLSSCIIGWFQEKAVCRLIGCKGKPRLIVALGYPKTDSAAEKREKVRKPADSIIKWV